jgi:predicted ArsR family transcriptional regulator
MFGERKRTYLELQILILKSLKKGNLTVYELAKRTKLHFNVVKHQLILLKGQDFVEVCFKHNQFKLFGLLKDGEKYLRKITR